jgi:hypothetical protein
MQCLQKLRLIAISAMNLVHCSILSIREYNPSRIFTADVEKLPAFSNFPGILALNKFADSLSNSSLIMTMP